MTSVPVFQTLLTSMERRGSRVAIDDGRDALSYAQVVSRVGERRAELDRAGLSVGDRVSVAMRHHTTDVVNLLAVLLAGAVAVPCDSSWPELRQNQVERDAGVRFRIDENAVVPLGATNVRVIGAVSPELALLIYTSGSTAEPRGVMVTSTQVEFCMQRIDERLGYRSADRLCCPIRLSFDYGLYQILLAFSAGATLVLCDATDPFGWLQRSVATTCPSVLVLTPSVARAALVKWSSSCAYNDVRLITFTGESVDEQLLRRVVRAFPRAKIVLMYGITECKRVSISEPDEWHTDPTAVGRPLRGTEVVVRDSEGNSLDTGQVGELHVHGPHLASGYWNDPGLTLRKFPLISGRRELATEDLGYIDHSGAIHVLGRIGDTYKERGQRTSTQEIEMAALKVGGVKGAVCIPPRTGAPSTLVAATSSDLNRHALVKSLTLLIGPERVPRRIVRVDALPLTVNGKPDRTRLRLMASQEEGFAW